ncbi:MAG TPA: hypothetical protein VGZ73_10980 [Bryobacteraceae bacterium]|nr:hypothetical protein [Bryobacteraceae bacterium]
MKEAILGHTLRGIAVAERSQGEAEDARAVELDDGIEVEWLDGVLLHAGDRINRLHLPV